jgi:hypothetical protein
MPFYSVAFITLSALLAQIQAFPGVSGTANDTGILCGSNQVICHDSNQVFDSYCYDVLSALQSQSNQQVPVSPRSFCVNGCCVSWANDANGLLYGDLIPAAESVLANCVQSDSGYVSGLTRDTLLAGTCTTQCLSDRPQGCTN